MYSEGFFLKKSFAVFIIGLNLKRSPINPATIGIRRIQPDPVIQVHATDKTIHH
jgi:hypothetical protein